MYFGIDRKLLDRIYSLDEKWYVEIWNCKYYFFGIEVHAQKKEIVKHIHRNQTNLSRSY